jgi:peptide/nickel transport system substrate-binding protein
METYMKKNRMLLLSLVVLTLLLQTACKQNTAETVTTSAARTITPVPASPSAVNTPAATKQTDKVPQYGGTVVAGQTSDITGFDEAFTAHNTIATIKMTNEELLTGDWTKGPAGTGQFQFITSSGNRIDSKAGSLAETWESPEPGYLIFYIRKGVHFALDPNNEASRLANGRELTADDIVFNLQRYVTTPTNYIRAGYPNMCISAKITAPDKWTVDIRCAPEYFADAITMLPDWASVFPPEVIQKYGNVRDWRSSVGSGPFILTDYVSGSSATLVRNRGYWGKDPIGTGKGNQLPYVDGVRLLIIPDPSTMQAAFRTAKIVDLPGLVADDYKTMTKGSPELMVQRGTSLASTNILMRTDKPNLPFKDKRVRQALLMATDLESIKRDLYGGEAQILSWPMFLVPDYSTAYVPLEQCPAAVQELYKYNPEKAKSLLAEAGYPNGFKTTVLTSNTVTNVDLLSAVASMWARVGVTLSIDAREPVVFNNLLQQRAHTECILTIIGGLGSYFKLAQLDGTGQYNASFIDDPYVKDVKVKIYEAFNRTDWAKVDELYRNMLKDYVLEQTWAIPTGLPYNYDIWWPWLKNYHGEQNMGYANTFKWTQFAWLDLDMKEKMTGSR